MSIQAETKVGIFVAIAIVLLSYMSVKVGGLGIGDDDGYTLYVTLENVAGVDVESAVRIAGVDVGYIRKIELADSKAILTLSIFPKVRVGSDYKAALKSRGLLGEKYLELLPGTPNSISLKNGDTIEQTVEVIDMDKLVSVLGDVANNVKGITDTLNNVMGGAEGEKTIRDIITNLDELLANLNDFSYELKTESPHIMANLKSATTDLKDLLGDNKDDVRASIANLRSASEKLELAFNDIGEISEKINSGEGTLGKLINDDTTHENLNKTLTGINSFLDKADRFKTYVGYRAEYLEKTNDLKSYFSIKIQPKADKYYLVEIIDDPAGLTTEESSIVVVDGVPTTISKTKVSDKVKFSVQIAKRLRHFTIRGGIIESTGGFAVDYSVFRDRLKFSVEAFDFDDQIDPHVKAYARFNLTDFVYVVAGVDNPFNDELDLDSAYYGLGLEINDDDIKYILSGAAGAL